MAKKLTPQTTAYTRLVWVQFLGEFTLIYPLYSIMFAERSQISAAGIGTLLAVWQIVQILAEIPTGVLADRFSKKYSIVLGRLLKTMAMATWLVAPHFSGYMAGFVIWGVGEAFASGATQAYLYELTDETHRSSFLKRYSRLESLKMVSYTVAYFMTFLIGPNYPLLIGLSVLTCGAALATALTLPQSKPIPTTGSIQLFKQAVRSVVDTPVLGRQFALGVLVAGALGMLVELIVVNYHQYGVSTRLAPLFISLTTLVTALLFWSLHRYDHFIKRHVVVLPLLACSIYFVTINAEGTYVRVLGLFLVARYIRVLSVSIDGGLQHLIDGEVRATVGSLYSMVGKLHSALQIFLVGLLATNNIIIWPTFWFTIGTLALFALFSLRQKHC